MNKIVQYIVKHPIVSSASSAITAYAINTSIKFVMGKITAELQVDSFGNAYNAIIEWIIANDLLKNTNIVKFASARASSRFTVPDGTFWTFYKGRPLKIYKGKGEGDYGRFEILRLTLFGGKKDDLYTIVKDIEMPDPQVLSNVDVQVYQEGYWQRLSSKAFRAPETFILKEGQKERIFADVEWFFNNREWYVSKGIPHHRGYLISGEPGTGKSTLVNVLASKFHRSVYILNLGSIVSDDSLYAAMAQIPEGVIIALEDVDCVGLDVKRTKEQKQTKGKDAGVTIGGLLNCLDGMVTPDGVITIMTTNFPEKLDPALIRPGRADVHESFDALNKSEQETLSRLFYDEPVAVDTPVTAAILQGIFIRNINDRDAAQKELEKTVKRKRKPVVNQVPVVVKKPTRRAPVRKGAIDIRIAD
jgi:chaperone BCS1